MLFILEYARKKHYTEKLFVQFQLSDRVPDDNFYRLLNKVLDLQFLYKATEDFYGNEGQHTYPAGQIPDFSTNPAL